MDNHFKIIVPFYNVEKWISATIKSILLQDYGNFECVLVDDVSTDKTREMIDKLVGSDNRFTVIPNKEKKYVLENICAALKICKPKAQDIIVILDGDDWFYDSHALAIVAEVYERTGCWLTYGSYVTTNGDAPICREYIGHPRQAVIDGWPFSHLRTFKRHLWDLLEDHNFKDKEGNFYTAAADVVIFVPILEKIGYDKVEFIRDPLLVYNLPELVWNLI